jgi:hypothetical protein
VLHRFRPFSKSGATTGHARRAILVPMLVCLFIMLRWRNIVDSKNQCDQA